MTDYVTDRGHYQQPGHGTRPEVNQSHHLQLSHLGISINIRVMIDDANVSEENEVQGLPSMLMVI